MPYGIGNGNHTGTMQSAFTPDKQTEALKLASSGKRIREICQAVELTWYTIARFIITHPEFAASWHEARQIGAEIDADDIQALAENAETVADAMIAKVKSDNLKTSVAWRNPRKFGPRVEVNHSHTLDLREAIEEGKRRSEVALSNLPEMKALQQRIVPTLNERLELADYAHRRALSDNDVYLGKPKPMDIEISVIPSEATGAFKGDMSGDREIVDGLGSGETGVGLVDRDDQNVNPTGSLSPGFRDTSDEVSLKDSDTYVPEKNAQDVVDESSVTTRNHKKRAKAKSKREGEGTDGFDQFL